MVEAPAFHAIRGDRFGGGTGGIRTRVDVGLIVLSVACGRGDSGAMVGWAMGSGLRYWYLEVNIRLRKYRIAQGGKALQPIKSALFLDPKNLPHILPGNDPRRGSELRRLAAIDHDIFNPRREAGIAYSLGKWRKAFKKVGRYRGA